MYGEAVTTRCETPTGPVFCQLTRNAARGKIDGFESEFTIIPADWLSIAGNVGLIDGHYTKYEGLDPTGTIEENLSGTAFLYIPKWKYSLTSTLKVPTPDAVGHLSITPAWSPVCCRGLSGMIFDLRQLMCSTIVNYADICIGIQFSA
jgi:hypothetical protein